MESSAVLFTPRIHLFACTHPSVSNTFDCNALFAYKHQTTAFVQTRLDGGSLFVNKHGSTALVQQLCASNMFGLWFLVCLQASVSSPVVSDTFRLWFLFVYTHLSTAFCFNTFDYGGFFVYPPAHTNMKVTSELEEILY